MGHRLSKITTRTGDQGSTGLGDGSRVDKDSPRVEALGSVDELNCTLGLLLTEDLPTDLHRLVTDIQHDLFDLGGELSIPGRLALTDKQVAKLENHAGMLNSALSPLKEFILPGGSRAAALCHLACAVCRHAERRVITLSKTEAVSGISRKYLNRLSDLLFIAARTLNKSAGRQDALWEPGRKKE